MNFDELVKHVTKTEKEVKEAIQAAGKIENVTKMLVGDNLGFGGILHITRHQDGGKMNGFHSLSTCNMLNDYCLGNMQKENTVCYKCYATRSEKMYPNLTAALVWNTVLLKNYLLSENQLPDLFNVSNFRFEAFGDVSNLYQLINYTNICRKNPDTKFSIWTKNLYYFHTLFHSMEAKKPKNLTIVYSSPLVNQVAYIPDSYKNLVDIRFTVFTKEFAKENDIEINCKKKCRTCMKCYGRKSKTKNIVDIYELLK